MSLSEKKSGVFLPLELAVGAGHVGFWHRGRAAPHSSDQWVGPLVPTHLPQAWLEPVRPRLRPQGLTAKTRRGTGAHLPLGAGTGAPGAQPGAREYLAALLLK